MLAQYFFAFEKFLQKQQQQYQHLSNAHFKTILTLRVSSPSKNNRLNAFCTKKWTGVFLSTCEQDHFFYIPLYSMWTAVLRMPLFLLDPFLQRSVTPHQSRFHNLCKIKDVHCKSFLFPPQVMLYKEQGL